MEANADVKINREYKDRLFRFIYLDGFFRKHREGVVNMSLIEYNEAEFIENRRAEGRAEGILDTIIEFVKDGLCPVSEGARRAGMSIEEFEKLAFPAKQQ